MQSLLTVNNSVTLLSVNIAPSSFIAAFTLGLVFLYIYLISVARVPSPLPVLRTLGSLPFRVLPSSKDSKELAAPPDYTARDYDYDPFNVDRPYYNQEAPLRLSLPNHRLLDAPPHPLSPSKNTVLTHPYYLQQGGFSSDLHLATQLTQLAHRRAAAPTITDASPPERQKRKHSSSGGGHDRETESHQQHESPRDRAPDKTYSRPSSDRKSSFFRSRGWDRDRDGDRESEREKPLPRLRQTTSGSLNGNLFAKSLPSTPPASSPTRSSTGARIAAGLGLSPERSANRKKHRSISGKEHLRDGAFTTSTNSSGSPSSHKDSEKARRGSTKRDGSPHGNSAGIGRRLFGRGWPVLESPKKRHASRVAG
ncbi:hypothetical protein CFIMG_002420RA [Ceratocystis fimbriata CBS 114723]|uniref:Uncharacterized protein n=1 Tax=Ceratocystis fimbriata CBS 114723 TaxID=1035309 RepID=A0A2C5XB47_9PEZI|nr:hypothetical protein CFIMG_002420RA [Ceratocystis fimbriata CBS 114723]